MTKNFKNTSHFLPCLAWVLNFIGFYIKNIARNFCFIHPWFLLWVFYYGFAKISIYVWFMITSYNVGLFRGRVIQGCLKNLFMIFAGGKRICNFFFFKIWFKTCLIKLTAITINFPRFLLIKTGFKYWINQKLTFA